MDNLFQKEWFGRYWYKTVLNDPVVLLIGAAVIVVLAFAFLRMPRGK